MQARAIGPAGMSGRIAVVAGVPGDPTTIYVIDISSYVFRAYHALPPLSNSKGEPTHAVAGVASVWLAFVAMRRFWRRRPRPVLAPLRAGADGRTWLVAYARWSLVAAVVSFGVTLVLALFYWLFYRGIVAARSSQDRLGTYICMLVVAWLALYPAASALTLSGPHALRAACGIGVFAWVGGLGAVELTPVEVTQIYQSLAAGGYSTPLRAVTAVQTPDGDELVRYPMRLLPQPHREAIGVLNFALTRVVEEGTARGLPAMLGQDTVIAGKTGTTNERRDSWFVGYTRNRVAAAWVGLDDNRPAGVTGSNAAMHVWARLFRDLPIESFEDRKSVV